MAVAFAKRPSFSGMHKKKPSNRKNSWVMLAESSGYTPLPGETTLYQSPPRTTLSLQSSHRNPPSEAFSQQCKSGVIYLTNRRIIYLPTHPTPSFTSFAAPILHVSDSRVTAPWFGANKWEATIVPVYNGGIPPQHAALELVMEFKEGGAFDFATTFERLRERLRHAVDVASEAGERRGGGLDGVNMAGVHLEDLPRYEEAGGNGRVEERVEGRVEGRGSVGTMGTMGTRGSVSEGSAAEGWAPPREPPPGYEEVQRGSVAEELERRLREEGEGA